MGESLRIVRAQAHRQFNGTAVAFVQFNVAPPEGLKRLIKQVGGGSYRAPPPGLQQRGWHIHNLGELARAVEGKWASFAKVLRDIRHTIRHRPDEVPQPSRQPHGLNAAGRKRPGKGHLLVSKEE